MTDRAYLTRLMPMCVIWGGDDDVIPVRHARRRGRSAPGREVEVIPDAGHFPHKDHPSGSPRSSPTSSAATRPASLLEGGRRRPGPARPRRARADHAAAHALGRLRVGQEFTGAGR